MVPGIEVKVLPRGGGGDRPQLIKIGPLQPAAEPSDEGSVPLEQRLEGGGKHHGGVGGEEDRLVEGEQGADHIQSRPLHKDVVVQQS